MFVPPEADESERVFLSGLFTAAEPWDQRIGAMFHPSSTAMHGTLVELTNVVRSHMVARPRTVT